MLIAIIILALSVSIDSFGIGITYGIRNTTLPISSKFILVVISFLFSFFAVFIGNTLLSLLSDTMIKIISVGLLILLGLWIIYISIREDNPKEIKTHKIFFKTFGITIQIIKNPSSSDLNDSKNIEKNEAVYLATALSLDSICVGISSSSFEFYNVLFPILVPLFQFIFINLGIKLGKKIILINSNLLKFWNILSGVLLIIIGLFRLF